MNKAIDDVWLPAALERRLGPTAATIWAERAWDRYLKWPALAWAVYLVTGVVGLWSAAPGTIRVAVLWALVLLTLAAAALAARRVVPPGRAAAISRLEEASRLKRGSLDLLDGGATLSEDALSDRLWRRARDAAAKSRVGLVYPRIVWNSAPASLIAAALCLAAALGILASGGGWQGRLAAAFSFYPTDLSAVVVTAMLEPPPYVDRRARTFRLGLRESIDVDVLPGSRLTLRVDGPDGDWRLSGPGDRAVSLGARRQLTEKLNTAGEYDVRYGSRLAARLNFGFAADAKPAILFNGEPALTATGALRIAYELADDHGRSSVRLLVAGGGQTRRRPLEKSIAPGERVSFIDLMPDPLAGEIATLRLEAKDGAGNIGVSKPIRVRLSERTFRNEAARQIIAERRRLLTRPSARLSVAQSLSDMADRPEAFDGSLSIYSGLKSASYRLAYDQDADWLQSTARLLWDMALALDDNGASAAMDSVRDTMDKLTDAIRNGDDQQLKALSDQLTAQMAEYLQRQITGMLLDNPDAAAQVASNLPSLDASALDQMMSEFRDRLAAGDADAAEKMLRDLRQLMESLSFGGMDAAASKAAREASETARRAADEARQIAEAQQQLQTETLEEGIRRMLSGNSEGLKAKAATQHELARQVEQLQDRIMAGGATGPNGEAAAALDRAKAAMRRAAQGMNQGDGQQALEGQGQALTELAAAGQALGRAAQAGASAGLGPVQPGQAGGGLDPLGRPGAGFGQGMLELPDNAQLRRVEAIRALLEKRAADPLRSDKERAYYLRLLKRF